MPSPPKNFVGYLPSLDGWRAVAILAVLWIHELPLTVAGHDIENPWQRLGSEGVVLFFAISGILICSRILEEEELTGSFHLKNFYIRRIFRIQPAALAYLAVVALLALSGLILQGWKYWFGALLSYENFQFHMSEEVIAACYWVGHFWTLAVEEHFYLLVSLALFFVKRRRLAIFGGALVLIKLAQMVAVHYTPNAELRRTYWQIHMLLWPSVAAIALRKPAVRAWAVRWLRPEWLLPVTLVGVVLLWGHGSKSIALLEYAFTLWVISTVLHPRSWPTRVLEWAPLRFLGRISYSIYLWHVIFYLRRDLPAVPSHALWLISGRPWKYIATLAVATASYYFIEKPFVRLGHKLAAPATAGHKDMNGLPTLSPDRN